MTSQELILAQMHALDDVTAVVEHTPNVLCVHCTCEMWVAVVLAITTCCADTLQKFTNQFQLYSIHTTTLPAVHDVQH
jgi:general stress protein CsbA